MSITRFSENVNNELSNKEFVPDFCNALKIFKHFFFLFFLAIVSQYRDGLTKMHQLISIEIPFHHYYDMSASWSVERLVKDCLVGIALMYYSVFRHLFFMQIC